MGIGGGGGVIRHALPVLLGVLAVVLTAVLVRCTSGPVLHAQEGRLIVRDRCQCWVEPDGTWVCGER
jgi:hypothetical protein